MSLKIYRTEDGITNYPLHVHKNFEIMIYIEGKGYMRTEHGDIPFQPGTIIIVPPNIKHGSRSENQFKNISIEGDFSGYFDFDTVKSFGDNERGEGQALATIIYNNRFENNPYLSSLCTSYLQFLTQRVQLDFTVHSCVQRIVFAISNNAFDSKIDISHILSKSGYSEDYIRACFKSITGKTPNEFLTEIRIKHACFLIDVYHNELSLGEIAERSGYLDYVYFSKKFKSVMNMSPREYRKK